MFMAWIRSNLGPFAAVLDYFYTKPERLTVILVIWAFVYFIGLLQLKRIEAKTTTLILRESATHLKDDPQTTAAGLYEKIYPVWVEEFAKWKYWFIPHRNDLWPVRVTMEHVLIKMPFTPDWLAAVLAKNGMPVISERPS